jgi:kynurenine formamidase
LGNSTYSTKFIKKRRTTANREIVKKGLSLDELPLENLTGNAVVIDVSANALKNRDYQITIADIEAWELEHGELKPNTIILFKTGYGQFYPDREKYFGTAKKGVEAMRELSRNQKKATNETLREYQEYLYL